MVITILDRLMSGQVPLSVSLFASVACRGNPQSRMIRTMLNSLLLGMRFFKKNPDGCITETEYPSCGKLFSALHKEALRRLLLRMLHPNPEKRATMQEVLADRWMKIVECCCPEPGDLVRCVTCIDAAGKGSGKLASKMIVQKMHHHIPVDKRRRIDVDET